MSMYPPKVFVLVHHHGTEGYGEPIAVFFDKHDAEAAKALLDSGGYSSARLLQTPVWPNLPQAR